MPSFLKVTRMVAVTQLVDIDSYVGMSPEGARRYELDLDIAEQLQAVTEAIECGEGDNILITCSAELVD